MSKKVDTWKVAVYGSLRPTMNNNTLLDESKHICTISAIVPYEMYDLGYYPALRPALHDKECRVVFDIYEVTQEVFEALDRLERYPLYYDRDVVTLLNEDVWLYYLPEENMLWDKEHPCVVGGDWVHYWNTITSQKAN